ncbi:period circadian protein homolog 2 isoform X2 [Coregonus clupeaformis]|uniref:period circadian protein homolog 2 isoform X2 n=1 Tax=Coregonus clupeaformis TaxID=59861 RepID=UPI001BE0F1B0|nr:period circadian protein homolog 2 isoform X2 [Coregonus clupeaformis]
MSEDSDPGCSAMARGASSCSSMPRGASGCSSMPRGASGCSSMPRGASGCSSMPRGASGCSSMSRGASGCSSMARGASGCRSMARGASGCSSMPRGASGCSSMSRGASGCSSMSRGASGCSSMARGASGCRSMARGASGCRSMPRGASWCRSMAQLHCRSSYGQGCPDLGLASEGSDSSGQDPSASPHSGRRSACSRSFHEDVEMKSSGSSGTESHGNESHRSHGNESHSTESTGSSNGNSKDSALLESSGSNKCSNSHSPSPPSSSNAFSLLSSEQDNPSTSGCSSEESAKAKTQKELLRTLKELKRHLPSDKRNKGNKSSSLNTLKYALRCVKQVEANEEYYKLLMTNDSQPSGLDVSSYTIKEIDSITSEYTLKNNDIFAVAISLITGKIVYISDQAASILNCKRGVFKDAKFVEFLTPQDVSVFYSFTTPYRLPSWNICTGAESSPSDCMQEKSFFCRISGGKECVGDLQYYPFCMTPYLLKVQDKVHSEDQLCCLLLAERLHSGYEAPRIPSDKHIFTTTHTPSCVFQDVDKRAVPLLGYLPQDLIGTPVLLLMHPNDRPIMLAIHKKILQYAGQPFDHSSIRFCTRSGEYVIIDTSWSSFVNPWSRKVSFIIGRHKVRMGPVNEDVFAAPLPALMETKTMDSEVQEIAEQIHRLLLQPVHSTSSSGYGSVGSNDHLAASQVMTSESNTRSSSDNKINSNGSSPSRSCIKEEGESSGAKPRSFQEICKGIHLQKSQEQQIYKASSSARPETKKNPGKFLQKSPAVVRLKATAAPVATLSWRDSGASAGLSGATPLEDCRPAVQEEQLAFNDQTVYSYQQISCLDSVIRYLEGCNVPIARKRKCHSSDNTTSSDEDKQKGGDNRMQISEDPALFKAQPSLTPVDDIIAASGVVGSSSLAALAMPPCSKAESVVSITSQCSYSSTIVHVGDKKAQPESEIIEDVSGAGEAVEQGSQTPGPPPSAVSPPSLQREPYKKLGLTKQVLAAHTQREEQAFLCRFRELRGVQAFQANCSQYLEHQKKGQGATDAVPAVRLCRQAEPAARRSGRNKKTKSKRVKQNESSDSSVSHWRRQQQPRLHLLNQGLNQTSWSPSNTSQSTFPPLAYPNVVPGFPLQVYPGTGTMAGTMPTSPENSMPGFGDSQCNQDPQCPPQNIQPSPLSTPMVTPVVTLVLPNYMFPQMGSGAPGQQPFYQAETAGYPSQPQPFPLQTSLTFPPQSSFTIQAQFPGQNPFAPQTGFPIPAQPFSSMAMEPLKPSGETTQSRCSTPGSMGGRDQVPSPPVFQSRCSSPLQLNLLQLEETPCSLERQDSMVVAPSSGFPGNNTFSEKGRSVVCQAMVKITLQQVGSPGDGNQSEMLDILLHSDSHSGTSSATSGSMGSRSNGCGTSARTSNSGRSNNSGTSGCRTLASGTSASGVSGNGTVSSNHTSENSRNYFGSVGSSLNSSQKVKGHSTGCGSGSSSSVSEVRPMEVEQSQHDKYVLQDPLCLVTANADNKVTLTYQMPSRGIERLLREDRERLRVMQKSQPCFTGEQQRELVEVHPWMKRGGLPKVMDVKACVCCEEDALEAVVSEEQPDLDMGDTETETGEVSPSRKPSEEPLNTDTCPSPCPSSGLGSA